MINIFKNKKPYNQASNCTTTRILVKQFVEWLRRKQIRLAHWLQVSFERLAPWAKNSCVLLFLLVCVSTFTCIIASSIKIRSPVASPVYLIKFPRSRIENKLEKDLPVHFINAPDQKRIIQFREYMDSLLQSKSGSIIRDSILKARPGLIDSITRLENLLNSTNEK